VATFYSSIPTEWYELEGVYIDKNEPTQQPEIDSNAGLLKVVGQFPWGPVAQIVEIGAGPELEENLIGKTDAPADYPGFRALSGKKWGEIHAVRISEASQAKAAITVRAAGQYTIGTYDAGDSYELTFSNVEGGPITITSDGSSGDHTSEDEALEDLADKINAHTTLSEEVAADADTSNDVMSVYGNGNESWSVSTNSPATGAHSFTQGDNQYNIDAEYVGAVGDEIAIGHAPVNGGSDFELTVAWGNDVTTYGPFAWDDTTAVADEINDAIDFVDFEWASNFGAANNPPSRANNAHLSGGADASLGASDNQPYIDALSILEADEKGGVVMPLEPHHLDGTANNGLIAELQLHADKMGAVALTQAVSSSVSTGAYSLDNNITVANSYSDDRLLLAVHRVEQFIEGDLRTVDLAPFIASILVNGSPHISPAAARFAEYLKPVRAFEPDVAPTRADYVDARAAGALSLEKGKGGKWTIISGVTTAGNPIPTIRMEDLIAENSGKVLTPYQSEPPYPGNVRGSKGSLETMLETLEGSPENEDSQMIKGFTVQIINKTSDSVQYKTKVDLWGEMGSLINSITVGREVTIEPIE